jgi:hypothetical protein
VDADKQASRLIALAITASERGDQQMADELMKLAMESMDRPGQPVAQQQQQIQPKKEE